MAVKIVPGAQHPPPPTTAPATSAPPPPAASAPAASTPAAAGAQPAPTTTVPTTTTTSELERGWVSGTGSDRDLSASEISIDSGVQAGDLVSTSGVSESLSPPDLPVGTVSSVKRNTGSGLLDVHVTPSADVNKLNYVKVLLYCGDCATAGSG
jgi:hypothetical protein